MSKPIPFLLTVDPRSGTTIAEQIRTQLIWLITSEQLQAGEKLPAVRQLAQQLGVNLHTVRTAYQKLAADGLVRVAPGKRATVLPHEDRKLARIAGVQTSHTIGIIVPNMSNPFYQELVLGADETLRKDRFMIFICNCFDDPREAYRYFAQLSAKQVDGVIVASHDLSRGRTQDQLDPGKEIPLVTVDYPAARGYSVSVDLENAGYQATRHLLGHGHQRIGLISVDLDAGNVRLIDRGYERALSEAGRRLEPGLIARVPDFGLRSGAEGAGKLLGLKKPPTAIFTVADTLALGVLRACKANGLRIPGDLALASFNDIPTADLVDPPLTTTTGSSREMGREAADILASLIAGRKIRKKKVILPTTLVVRRSCGCPTDP